MTRNDVMRGSPLFAGCTDKDLFSLGEIARELQFNDGHVLFSEGDQAEHLMVVSSGTVQLELPLSIFGQTKNVAFEAKRRGDVVGWSALVPPHQFSLSARVSGGASVLTFSRDDLKSLFDNDLALGLRMMRNLAGIVGQRFHRTQLMWASEIQRSLDERYR